MFFMRFAEISCQIPPDFPSLKSRAKKNCIGAKSLEILQENMLYVINISRSNEYHVLFAVRSILIWNRKGL